MENKQTVFRKVSVKDRLPIKRASYLTNKGMYKWCKKYGFYNYSLFNIYKVNNIKWWLEEIELPSDNDVFDKAHSQHDDAHEYLVGLINGFTRGANYILKKLK